MSKILLRIFIFSILFQTNIFQLNDNSTNTSIGQLTGKKIYHQKLLQTLYSDSISNNYYYAVLYLGRNISRQTFLIDTEIDTISSPCHRSFFCNNNKSFFLNSSRRSRRRITCYSDLCGMLPSIGCINPKEYIKNQQCSFLSTKLNGDGFRGYYVKDLVFLQEDKQPVSENATKVYASYYLPIGCSLAEFGKYKKWPVDGIMGLNNKKKSFISVLYDLKVLKKNIFTICLGNRVGYLSLGAINRNFHESEKIEYIRIKSKKINSYQIKATQIKIGNTKPREINTDCVIDSGTPITYFPINIFNKILKDLIKYFHKQGNNFFDIFGYHHFYGYCTFFVTQKKMKEKIKSWPKINITFSKVTFLWRPQNYIYKVANNEACLGINNHTFNHIILGSNFMRGYDFIFDKEKKRIGFVKAHCSQIISKNIINDTYNDNIENQTNVTTEKKRHNVLMVKDDIEFLRGRNKELKDIKESYTFKKIVNIMFYSSITFVIFFVILITWILYRIHKRKRVYLDEEHKRLNQVDTEC